MITWRSTRTPVAACRVGLSALALATLTVVAVAQSSGGAAGAAAGQGNTAAGGTGQVKGSGDVDSMKGGVAGTGLGGTSPGFQGATTGATSGTGQSVQRPGSNGDAGSDPGAGKP